MSLYSLNTLALLALVVFGLVVPTGAVFSGDEVHDAGGLVISPHDGPNGAYAEVTSGDLTIDMATIGLNPNALTSVWNVFDLNNTGGDALDVWITHNATERVTFAVDGVGSIQGESNNVTLEPGEVQAVSLYIDTEGTAAGEEPLLREFQLHVDGAAEEPTPSMTPAPSASTATPTPTPTPTSTPTPVPTITSVPDTRVEDVEVVRDHPTTGEPRVRDVSVEEVLEGETDEDDARPPRAVIEHTHGEQAVVGNECPCAADPRLQAAGANALVEVGQEVSLSAAKSVVGSTGSVDRERRIVKAVDIDVPEDDEDEPATIRMRVNEERFAGADLTRPRIARLTEDGWQMLPTRIVGREGGQLLLEARTPGFSRFAVFSAPEVGYTWTLGDEEVTAEELRTRFDEPGYHNVTLTVTDAFGRSSKATYRVLVNDVPSVTIDVPENRTAGQEMRLRANVTDEVGNVTVGWTFPDGSQQSGLEARYTFPRGEHTVLVTVEDEYGAKTTVERTVAIGPFAEAKIAVDRVADSFSHELAIGLVSLAAFLLAALLRRAISSGRRGGIRLPHLPVPILSPGWLPLRSRSPTIVAFDDPSVDVRNRRFRIGHLRIEDPDGDLAKVEIAVMDVRGNEVARKTVELSGETEYVLRNSDVMPKSQVYVREDEEYTIRVLAADRHHQWTRFSRSRVRSPSTAETPA